MATCLTKFFACSIPLASAVKERVFLSPKNALDTFGS